MSRIKPTTGDIIRNRVTGKYFVLLEDWNDTPDGFNVLDLRDNTLRILWNADIIGVYEVVT